jgi:hypothetical protein
LLLFLAAVWAAGLVTVWADFVVAAGVMAWHPVGLAGIQAHLENKIFVNKIRPKVINLKFFEVAK